MLSHSLWAILLLLTHALIFVSSLGINCRGSGLCPLATFNNQNDIGVIQILRDVVWSSSKDNNTVYNSGAHVLCLSSSLHITLGVGVELDGIDGSFSLTGKVGTGGICLFPQFGGSLTLGQIRPLVDAILDHGCGTCGSVPIHFVDQGSNDPSDGILTFNYVAKPYCDEGCIAEVDSESFQAGTASPSFAAAPTTVSVSGGGDRVVTVTDTPAAVTETPAAITESPAAITSSPAATTDHTQAAATTSTMPRPVSSSSRLYVWPWIIGAAIFSPLL